MLEAYLLTYGSFFLWPRPPQASFSLIGIELLFPLINNAQKPNQSLPTYRLYLSTVKSEKRSREIERERERREEKNAKIIDIAGGEGGASRIIVSRI